METLTESSVVPHRHRPMSASGYFPKQDVPSNYFFPGPTGSSHGYPPFLSRGGGGRRDGEEGMEINFNSQRYSTGDELRRDSGQYPSQAAMMQHPSYRQQHMPRYPITPEENRNRGPIRGEDVSSNDPSSERRIPPGFPGMKGMPEFTTPPSGNSFDNMDSHKSISYHQHLKGERHSDGYPREDRRRSGNMGQPMYPGTRESVKSAYDHFEPERKAASHEKPEAVPVAYDNGENTDTESSNHFRQQFRDKLERSTSHETATSLWSMPMSQDYVHFGNKGGDNRPRAMTMDPSMHNRRDSGGPSSPYGNPHYPTRSSDAMFNKMRDHMNQYANVMNKHMSMNRDCKDESSSMHEFMNEQHRRSSGGGDGRHSTMEMMNRMMMSPDKMTKDGLLNQTMPMHPLQQEAFHRLQAGIPSTTSPNMRKSMNQENAMTSPIKQMMNTDASGASPHAMSGNNNSTIEMNRSSSTPQASQQKDSETSPKVQNTPANEKSFDDRESAKDSRDSNSNIGERAYFPGNQRGETSDTHSSPGFPAYKDQENDLSSKVPSDDMDKVSNDPISRMPKRELPDDVDDESFQGGCSSPNSHSPRSTSFGSYPPFGQQPFFSSPIRRPGQGNPFLSPRGLQDQMPVGPAFPFGKDLSSCFPLAGMGPDTPLPARMGPGTNFMPGMSGDDSDMYFCHLCSYSGK